MITGFSRSDPYILLTHFLSSPNPWGTRGKENGGSSLLSRRALLGHSGCRWPEAIAHCTGPGEGARMLSLLKAVGLGGHCSVLLRTAQPLAIPEELGLGWRALTLVGTLLLQNPKHASSPSKISSYFIPTRRRFHFMGLSKRSLDILIVCFQNNSFIIFIKMTHCHIKEMEVTQKMQRIHQIN